MYILGINAFHGDSSACLLKDGQLLAAVEEERFRRTKHWAGFPSLSIRYCLEAAGISITDIDHVAVNQESTANLSKKISYSVTHRPDLSLVMDRIRNKKKRAGILDLIAAEFPGEEIKAQHPEIAEQLSGASGMRIHVGPARILRPGQSMRDMLEASGIEPKDLANIGESDKPINV